MSHNKHNLDSTNHFKPETNIQKHLPQHILMKSYLSLAIAKSRTSSELSTSSEEAEYRSFCKQNQEVRRLEAEHQGWKEIHGFRGNMNWNSPCEVVNPEFQQPAETSTPPLPMSAKHIDYEDE